MFSRVQKGGTVFKPVTRPKSRTPNESNSDSTPSSSALDVDRSSVHPSEESRSSSVKTLSHPTPSDPSASRMSTSIIKSSDTLTMSANPASVSGEGDDNTGSIHVFPAIPPPVRSTSLDDHSPSISSPSQPPNSITSLQPQRPPPIHLAAGQSRAIPIIVSSVRTTSVPIAPHAGTYGGIVGLGSLEAQADSLTSSTRGVVPPEDVVEYISTLPPRDTGNTSVAYTNESSQGQISGDAPQMAINEVKTIKVPRPRKERNKKQDLGDSRTVSQENASLEGPGDAGSTKRTRRKRAAQNSVDPGSVSTTEPPTKRQRRKRKATEDTADEHPGSQSPFERSRSAGRGRKRAPSLPPFDPDAPPGEDIDPTIMTMATLCEDTGQGRVSTKAAEIQRNYATWKASNREKRARMRAIQEAKKYGRRGEDEEQVGQNAKPAGPEASRALAPTPAAPAHPPSEVVTSQEPPSNDEIDNGLDEPTTAGFDYSQNLATSRYNVQVRIGPNGETIVDEESLFVDRNEDDDTANYTHVEESDATKFVNSASYSKKVKGSRWSAEETELFYDALSQFGENYEMISMLLPGRDRKACKNKFKAEDKKNPARINYCLTHRVPYDMQTLSRLTGKDFSGPTPEIRAPTPLTLAETETNNQSETGTNNTVKRKRKSSTTPGIPSDGEEVMGTVEDYELEEQTLFGSPTAELAGTVETH